MSSKYKVYCGCLGRILVLLLIFYIGRYVYFERMRKEWSTERIERITGVRIPEYKIIGYDRGKRSFTGDHEDKYEIEFKTMPSEKLFDEIDKKVASGHTCWEKDGDKYYFSIFWGIFIDCPPPIGENAEDDITFDITLTKGEKKGKMYIGTW